MIIPGKDNKSRRGAATTGVLLICLLVFVRLSTLLSNSPAGKDHFFSGRVTDSTGSGVAGIEVRLFDGNDPGSPMETIITGPDGSFMFPAKPGGHPHILELQDDTGTGRILISAGDASSPLDIAWPVIEKIVILHTNDQHFTLNNLPELSATVNHIRNTYDNVFLFNAGDVFQRHPLRWIVNGRLMLDPGWFGQRAMYMINIMNELGYDLMTPGNHEFDYREPYTLNALDAADFPLLGANMVIRTDAFPQLADYVILGTNTGRKVAVLGLSSGGSPRSGIIEQNFIQTTKRYLSLKDSADIFLALTHIGLAKDRELARNFPQLDAIIGGHSHDLLPEAITVNSVLIAQAGGNPHFVSDNHPVYLGKIIIKMENGRVVEKSGKILTIEKGVFPVDAEYELVSGAGIEF